MPVTMTQSEYLGVLSYAPAPAVKEQAEKVIPALGSIDVLNNRTGLVMLPYTDSAKGVVSHLGKVLVSEAQVRLPASGVEGYGMCMGRDLVQAVAIAILDAAFMAGVMADEITAFVDKQAELLTAVDDYLLRCVESTRVEMQTF
jgi:alpha-D-ribose 1-methylphosphonate 5-triphosphate synthase subunit PhnG